MQKFRGGTTRSGMVSFSERKIDKANLQITETVSNGAYNPKKPIFINENGHLPVEVNAVFAMNLGDNILRITYSKINCRYNFSLYTVVDMIINAEYNSTISAELIASSEDENDIIKKCPEKFKENLINFIDKSMELMEKDDIKIGFHKEQ